jgi:hypothetical protein
MTERKLPRVTLLTGAGASKPLGLPTMDELLPHRFGESLPRGQRDVLDMAANWAMMQNPEVLDFEHLFTGVDLLAHLSSDDALAMAFASPHAPATPESRVGAFQFKSGSGEYSHGDLDRWRKDAAALTEQLRHVVHEQLAKPKAALAAELYRRLFAFFSAIVGRTGQVDVFTTNYDRAVETSYENQRDDPTGFEFDLVRGFALGARQRARQWKPEVYGDPPGNRFTVRLYKLHGSLDWRLEGDEILEVSADEYVQRNVVIYPVRKPITEAPPFAILLRLFEQRLDESNLCVVIGNSLRDEHIRRRLTDRLNADALRLVIVDPQPDRLASLLAQELGPERFSRLVETVAVPFGGSEEDQRTLEGKLGSAAAQSILDTKEQAYVAAMKADLHKLMTAQAAFFADSARYTNTLGPGGLDFTITPGNTTPSIALTADGWNATIGNVNTPIRCAVFIGSTSVRPATHEGLPACRGPD